ncbi:O-fucosyltransferase family protein [Heracleum sosnowskyi]|uniref:O-fucosyltransferase family protein n=1 Tax=Heracleum sosnowskyi TaxID=360622 RepID=A0AAD8M4S1_9APIA|nr:O-fucosyltransferase family protein [Heracleum sosnowskyi]
MRIEMEVRSESVQLRCDKLPGQVIPKTRLQVWFIRVCSSIVIWTCLVQIVTVGELWHPHLLSGLLNHTDGSSKIFKEKKAVHSMPPLPPARNYTSNGFLKVSCNGGLNQMRAAICDMVTVARMLNLTLVVPELDKTSFWADPSDFEDIFDVRHFIDSLRDEIKIIKRLPKKFTKKYGYQPLEMPPVSWSSEKYYWEQILPLFGKHKALRFTPQIEALGKKLVHILKERGPFIALHLRYEMDMLAFSGCTHGCTEQEAEELKQLRYAFPWWREKDIVSEERRMQGMCPLTPEETDLVLHALDFDKDIQIYIASGEIYGSERRLAALRASFPRIVKKEKLLDPDDLRQFQNHSSQMAALDFIVSVASSVFIPTYDGNMAKLVEGHRRYLGFRKTVQLDRRKLVELIDLHLNGTLSWEEFSVSLRSTHAKRMGQPTRRRVEVDKPKEEDYFYANPYECFCDGTSCDDSFIAGNRTEVLQ